MSPLLTIASVIGGVLGITSLVAALCVIDESLANQDLPTDDGDQQ